MVVWESVTALPITVTLFELLTHSNSPTLSDNCNDVKCFLFNLLDQKEPTLNFQDQDSEKKMININQSSQYYKQIIKPTTEELELHKDYLKNNLKKNFFN